jgi:hypothetical protein
VESVMFGEGGFDVQRNVYITGLFLLERVHGDIF